STRLGDAPWKCFHTGPLAPSDDAPSWARQSYNVRYRDPYVAIKNLLDNLHFIGVFDTAPYVELNAEGK
ncbi:hypothetical protein GGX14DRAFT_381024, partial [Mycena pura]